MVFCSSDFALSNNNKNKTTSFQNDGDIGVDFFPGTFATPVSSIPQSHVPRDNIFNNSIKLFTFHMYTEPHPIYKRGIANS